MRLRWPSDCRRGTAAECPFHRSIVSKVGSRDTERTRLVDQFSSRVLRLCVVMLAKHDQAPTSLHARPYTILLSHCHCNYSCFEYPRLIKGYLVHARSFISCYKAVSARVSSYSFGGLEREIFTFLKGILAARDCASEGEETMSWGTDLWVSMQ